MKKISFIGILIRLYALAAWIVNIIKFVECDFSGPIWKEEIIHGIGLIPGVSMITCWF